MTRNLDYYFKNQENCTTNSTVCEGTVELNNENKKYGDVKMENKITTSSLMKDYQNVCDYTLAHADELKAKVEAILEPVEGLYNYSPHNFFLAQMQLYKRKKIMEDVFAAYKSMQSIGRQVKRGEKGLKILVPVQKKVKDSEGHETGETELRFILGNCFGLSQTFGEPLDKIGLLKNKGLINYDDIASRINIPIKYTDTVLTHGSTDGESISISTEFDTDDQLSTLLHELSHIRLNHFDDKVRENSDRAIRECEAEACAYILTTAIGFENEKSAAYLATWNANEEIMQGRGARIVNTAFGIVKELKINELLLAKNKEHGFIDKDVEI